MVICSELFELELKLKTHLCHRTTWLLAAIGSPDLLRALGPLIAGAGMIWITDPDSYRGQIPTAFGTLGKLKNPIPFGTEWGFKPSLWTYSSGAIIATRS